jgi:hypothetical protein
LVLHADSGAKIRMSVMNDGKRDTRELGSRVSVGFPILSAIALVSGELAAD